MVARDDSDNEDGAVGKDEHGDPFKDFGFLSRVEVHKEAGNTAFARAAFGEALAEYDAALQLLLTVAEDRSIVVGQKKWNQVIVIRSLLHLNKSACYCKMGSWREAAAEATSCLQGNIPTETAFTHPHILADAKRSSIPEVDPRLTAAIRTKAWFRMSEGYLHMGYFARAKHAAARATTACEDEKLRSLIAKHSDRISALARRAQRQQLQRFRGYWDKLEQQQGGYVKRDLTRRGQTKSKWEGLGATERLQHVNALDGSDGDDDSDYEGFVDEGRPAPMLGWDGPPEAARAAGDPATALQKVWQQRQDEELERARAWEARRVAPATTAKAAVGGTDADNSD